MDVDFDKLLNDVMENPELLLDSTNISNEQIIELQKRMNPYIGLSGAYDPENKQIAVCSYTNLREDYLRRFTMTSLVGFIFQMLHEYEVPKEQRIWKTDTEKNKEMFNITNLKEQLQGMVTILEEAESTELLEKKLQKKQILKELIADESESSNTNESLSDSQAHKEIYDLQQKKMGILFTVTSMVKQLGLIADSKIKYTTEEAMKFPEIKEIIKNKKQDEFPEREFPDDLSKEIINNFLKHWFTFDPSVHIRSGLNKDVIKTEIITINNQEITIDSEDPSHLTIEELRQIIDPEPQDRDALNIILSNKQTLSAMRNIIRNDPDLVKYVMDNVDKFKHYLLPVRDVITHIPSQDTFHRWSYFTEVNYEELRTITETLYPEKSDLDWAIAIWTTFKGTDAELDEQFTNYCQNHNDEMPSIVKALEIGKWSLLADFKENRKNVQFYNKHTEVLKKIIDRHTEDKKIGTELMRNRVRQVKAKNIAEQGPDAPGLKNYKATMSGEGKDLTSKGVERVITSEEMKRLEKAQGNIKAAKELEVIEEYEKMLQGLNDIKKYRELNTEETNKFLSATDYLSRAKEMINVPDNAIQVDVFTTDTKTGAFNKSHFYTKCDEALEEESKYIK